MTLIRSIASGTFVLAVFAFATGCAGTPEQRDPRDPWEGANRAVFEFNEAADRAVIRPLAVTYEYFTPRPVRRGVGNFFSNLGDVGNLANNLLQLKFEAALNDFGRLTFNSTFGLFGVIDVASHMDLPKNNEDFGQTLGYWGVPSGPYVVLPFLGPSTLRDAPSRYVDARMHPLYYHDNHGRRNIAAGVMILDMRAGFLSTERALEDLTTDRYVAIRDFYLDRREYLVHDGEVPGQDRGADLFDELEALEAEDRRPAP